MRIACSGMPKVKKSDVSIQSLKKTDLGSSVVKLLQEAVDNEYIRSGSVKRYLNIFKNGLKDGTCYGEASSMIIASQKIQGRVDKNFGLKVLQKAKLSDQIIYQLMEELQTDVALNIDNTRTQGRAEKNVHKSHLVEKERRTFTEMTSPVFLAKSRLRKNIFQIKKNFRNHFQIPFHRMKSAKPFLKRLTHLTRAVAPSMKKYTIAASKDCTKNECLEKIQDCIQKIDKRNAREKRIRLGFCTKDGGGHAIAIFLHQYGSPIAGTVYDAANPVDARDTVVKSTQNGAGVMRSFISFRDFLNRLKSDLGKEIDPKGEILIEVF